MKTKLTLALLLIASFFLMASSENKNKCTIAVFDKDTKEAIPFCNIFEVNNDKINLKHITNIGGIASIDISEKLLKFKITCIGYSSEEFTLEQGKTSIRIELKKEAVKLSVCTVYAQRVSLSNKTNTCGSTTIESTKCFGQWSSGCVFKSDTVYGINERSSDQSVGEVAVVAYPNPSHGSFRLKSNFENYEMKVFDITGKLVLEKKSLNDGEMIDTQEMKPGVYVVCLTSHGITKNTRCVFE